MLHTSYTTQEIISQVSAIHAEKGWRAVYSFLNKHNIKYGKSVVEFGFGEAGIKRKSVWLTENRLEGEFRAHFYSVLVKARINKWGCTVYRGQSIILTQN